jgi:hypothetical protein
MAYVSRKGHRPNEYASKSSHGQLVQDSSIKSFLENCIIPRKADEVDIPNDHQFTFIPPILNPIKFIIAIDGGFEEIGVRDEFPSSSVCFFQLGALIFSREDLENLEQQPFIKPEDMSKLKQIQRFKLVLPIRNVRLNSENDLRNSIRRAIYDFYRQRIDGDDETLIETLRWFVYQEYSNPSSTWVLGSCPHCFEASIPLHRSQITKENTFKCLKCGGEIYLTDVFRLHEAIDNELGAGGILGYVITSFEQILLIHVIRLLLKIKPGLLKQTLFIKDGPLAFFGQTANLHKPMRLLVNFLLQQHDLYMAGLEKSGAFVEHADEISKKLPNSTVLLLNNDYIYKYIIPGKADSSNPYGKTTYYSNKLIFKTSQGGMHVVSIPNAQVNVDPILNDYPNLMVILANIEKLKCDMYDNALLPVALANKLVSLANIPSSRILQHFAVSKIVQ